MNLKKFLIDKNALCLHAQSFMEGSYTVTGSSRLDLIGKDLTVNQKVDDVLKATWLSTTIYPIGRDVSKDNSFFYNRKTGVIVEDGIVLDGAQSDNGATISEIEKLRLNPHNVDFLLKRSNDGFNSKKDNGSYNEFFVDNPKIKSFYYIPPQDINKQNILVGFMRKIINLAEIRNQLDENGKSNVEILLMDEFNFGENSLEVKIDKKFFLDFLDKKMNKKMNLTNISFINENSNEIDKKNFNECFVEFMKFVKFETKENENNWYNKLINQLDNKLLLAKKELEVEKNIQPEVNIENKYWLNVNQKTYGPYNKLQIDSYLKQDNVDTSIIFLWHDKMDNWKKINDTQEFKSNDSDKNLSLETIKSNILKIRLNNQSENSNKLKIK